jgi:hypothetical protein
LPEPFLEDFAALCRACGNAGLKLLPSLMSFEWFQPAVRLTGDAISRGRRLFVFGRERTDEFLSATLAPLLQVSASHRDSIFAWEIMNEPDWVIEGGPIQINRVDYGILPTLHWVPSTDMSRFLLEAVDRVRAAGFVASVGFGRSDLHWLSPGVRERFTDWADQGTYVHQVHHYPTFYSDYRLEDHAALPIRPCLLGEMPTGPGGTPSNLRWRDPELRMTERDPHRYLEARLELAQQRAYPAALLWACHSTDSRSAFGPDQQAQVRRFAASRLRE